MTIDRPSDRRIISIINSINQSSSYLTIFDKNTKNNITNIFFNETKKALGKFSLKESINTFFNVIPNFVPLTFIICLKNRKVLN